MSHMDDANDDAASTIDLTDATSGVFNCVSPCTASFQSDYDLLHHILQDHRKAGYVHLPLDAIRTAGLEVCDVCLRVSLKGKGHACNCLMPGFLDEDFAKTQLAFHKCLASASLASLNLGHIESLDDYDWPQICTREFRVIAPSKRTPTFAHAFRYISNIVLSQLLQPLAWYD